MSREDVQTNLRLPADLKDKLQEAALENNRSLSAEVVVRLRSTFQALPAFVSAMRQQQEALADLEEKRSTLVLLLSAVDPKVAPKVELDMLKRRINEVELAISNTERRIKQFAGELAQAPGGS